MARKPYRLFLSPEREFVHVSNSYKDLGGGKFIVEGIKHEINPDDILSAAFSILKRRAQRAEKLRELAGEVSEGEYQLRQCDDGYSLIFGKTEDFKDVFSTSDGMDEG